MTDDNAQYCIIKCRSPNNVKVTKLQRKCLAGQVGCMGVFRNYIHCQSEKVNGRGNITQIVVHSSIEEINWET
jgi:hypothetical protein